MKSTFKTVIILLLAVSLISTGCSSSKKVFCGCPNEHGMVGYK